MEERNDPIDIKEFKIKLDIPEGYEFGCVDDNKVVLIPKQPKYPKTYEECCRVVIANPHIRLTYDNGEKYAHDADNLRLYDNIRKLLICRDAYWKMVGEQMGLDEPWKPENPSKRHIFTIENCGGNIIENAITDKWSSRILVFPTAEIRDAFYANFKNLIEACKEFL